MSESEKPNPEVQPKPIRRRFSVEYKRRIAAEAEQCQHGELGALLRHQTAAMLTYTSVKAIMLAIYYSSNSFIL